MNALPQKLVSLLPVCRPPSPGVFIQTSSDTGRTCQKPNRWPYSAEPLCKLSSVWGCLFLGRDESRGGDLHNKQVTVTSASLLQICNHNTGKNVSVENKASPLLLPLPPYKCHCVSTRDNITIINKTSPCVSQR